VYLPPRIGLAHFTGVQPLTDHVENVTEHGIADGNRDTATRIDDRRSAGEPVGRLQTDATRPALADLLGNLCCDENLVAVDDELDLDGSVDLGQRVRRNSTSMTGPAIATMRPFSSCLASGMSGATVVIRSAPRLLADE